LSSRIHWSHPPTEADGLLAGKGGARGSWLFDAAPANRSSVRAMTLSTSPISKLSAKDDERRQAKRHSLAGKLTLDLKMHGQSSLASAQSSLRQLFSLG